MCSGCEILWLLMNHLLLREEMSQLIVSKTFNKTLKLCGIFTEDLRAARFALIWLVFIWQSALQGWGPTNQIKAVRNLIYPSWWKQHNKDIIGFCLCVRVLPSVTGVKRAKKKSRRVDHMTADDTDDLCTDSLKMRLTLAMELFSDMHT